MCPVVNHWDLRECEAGPIHLGFISIQTASQAVKWAGFPRAGLGVVRRC